MTLPWPQQDPVFPPASPSHQEACTSLRAGSNRLAAEQRDIIVRVKWVYSRRGAKWLFPQTSVDPTKKKLVWSCPRGEGILSEKWIAIKQELREKSIVTSRGYTSRLKANDVRVPQQADPGGTHNCASRDKAWTSAPTVNRQQISNAPAKWGEWEREPRCSDTNSSHPPPTLLCLEPSSKLSAVPSYTEGDMEQDFIILWRGEYPSVIYELLLKIWEILQDSA